MTVELVLITLLLLLLLFVPLRIIPNRKSKIFNQQKSQHLNLNRPLAYWDRGFESRLGHGCLSLVSVLCCQVEVSATSWSLVQRSPTECGVSECVIVKPRTVRWPRPPSGCRAIKKMPRSSKWSPFLRFPHQNSVRTCSVPHTCYRHPAHLILFDLITRIIFGDEYRA
jgi:hypothetical protein